MDKNTSQFRFDGKRSLNALFESQARIRAGMPAIHCGPKQITYSELDARSNQLARQLLKWNVSGGLVGVYMERSIETAIAILGIVKAGAGYLPIDPLYPAERVQFMLDDAQVAAMVTDPAMVNRLPQMTCPAIILDEDLSCLREESIEAVSNGRSGDATAYVIYTSGSTGKPKGVIVSHENVIRLFESTQHWFGFDDRDVWTLFHSFAFDLSVWELWGALLYGGRLIIVPYLISRSPERFRKLLAEERVTILNQTPSSFRQLIHADEAAAGQPPLALRHVIMGGEALELQSLKPWIDRHGDDAPQLINMYGITETTVHSTFRRIRAEDVASRAGSVIGHAIPDLHIYLLDDAQKPVRDGETGEIYVGGAGVAQGYLRRDDLNRERFIPNPFDSGPNNRLYRSGDLARRRSNGELEYLGRMDHQVKIRGFRIELGEVESVLNSHPAIRESVALAFTSDDGEKRLAAYIVCRNSSRPAVDELREHLGQSLPPYMIPATFMFLEALPLTLNGKVDRRALPTPSFTRPDLHNEYVAPRNHPEKILTEIWQEVLQINEIGIHDNFFALGGDSIKSIQILARAQEKGLRIPLESLFALPTIADLAGRNGDHASEGATASAHRFSLLKEEDRAKVPPDVEDAYPAAKLQSGMMFHSDFIVGSAVFHDVFSFRFTLPYNQEILLASVDRLVQRHPLLRTSFDLHNFSEPIQLVHRSVQVPFSAEDLRGHHPEKRRDALDAWVNTEKRHPFDWQTAPLMRLHVQRHTTQSFQFIVSFHHAIMDGWSLAAMLAELFQDYMAAMTGEDAAITPPCVSYSDFVRLERHAIESSAHQNFWRHKLENAVISGIPRWPRNLCEGGKEQVRGPEIFFSNETFARLKSIANSLGVPLRTPLLAAHCRVMRLVTSQTDVLTGLVGNGRLQAADGDKVLGLFLNTLPFRIPVNGGTWKELIRQTFEQEREILPYRRLPLAEIQRMAGGEPLFETVFDFVQFHVYEKIPGYKKNSFLEDHYFESNSFTLFTTFLVDASGTKLSMHFDYDPNHLCKDQVLLLCDYYRNIVEAIAANPDARYDRSSPLPEHEHHRLLQEWNETSAPLSNETFSDLFEQQVSRAPDNVAVVFEEESLTYAQLAMKVRTIASVLRQRGVEEGHHVGVYCARSIDMLASVLAVLAAGGAYVPLDPAFPTERIEFMVNDAELDLVLTQTDLLDSVPPGPGAICVNELLASIGTESHHAHALSSRSSPHSVAYMIYTSGSTGQPKGVQIEQHSLINFLRSMQKSPGLSARDTLLAVTTLSFDISILELLLPLTVGARTVIASQCATKDPAELLQLIEKHDVNVVQGSPSLWRALLNDGTRPSRPLKALCGGESLPRDLANRLLACCDEVWNMYGPTETTVWSCIHRVRPDDGMVPVGRPVQNTTIYLLDAELQPVPTGSEGEIYIGGEGIARGYWKREALTAERFPDDPFSDTPASRLYRTGDLGRFLPDGTLLCLGRIDHQVKVRGYRIEPEEIEATLARHPDVHAAVIAAVTGPQSDKALAAYWIARNGRRVEDEEFRSFLGRSLPEYMIPSVFHQMEHFPMTPNGKIDRTKLPTPEKHSTHSTRDAISPRTPLEAVLEKVWKDVLALDRISVRDNFLDLGGHSLLAMQIVARLRKQLNTRLTISSLFDNPTIEDFGNYLTKRGIHLESHAVATPGGRSGMVTGADHSHEESFAQP